MLRILFGVALRQLCFPGRLFSFSILPAALFHLSRRQRASAGKIGKEKIDDQEKHGSRKPMARWERTWTGKRIIFLCISLSMVFPCHWPCRTCHFSPAKVFSFTINGRSAQG